MSDRPTDVSAVERARARWGDTPHEQHPDARPWWVGQHYREAMKIDRLLAGDPAEDES